MLKERKRSNPPQEVTNFCWTGSHQCVSFLNLDSAEMLALSAIVYIGSRWNVLVQRGSEALACATNTSDFGITTFVEFSKLLVKSIRTLRVSPRPVRRLHLFREQTYSDISPHFCKYEHGRSGIEDCTLVVKDGLVKITVMEKSLLIEKLKLLKQFWFFKTEYCLLHWFMQLRKPSLYYQGTK